ncbi:MAG TPA: glycosyltransferase family 39 protein [Chitinophagaceae bacterium]|jgi:4-amino-4-deoxy-L-arabinose transferase-like glycosyltransferase|nr:glycosyltransferase family 39 protein [Chitinophagaceae bacterium]
MNFKIDRNVYLILSAFTLIHILLYFFFGIISGLESEKYIRQADYLLEGKFPSASKYYFYLPIIYLIALAKKAALGYGFVVAAQSLFSAFALLLFYKGTTKVFNAKVGLLASLGLCAFFPFMSWNFHLYSDSIFISLSMVLCYLVCSFEKQKIKIFVLILIVVLFMIFTRPFGALFIPPLFIYFLLSKYDNKLFRFITVLTMGAYIVIMYLSIQAIFHGGEDMDAMKPFIEEHIVCFVPNNPAGAKLNLKYYDNGVKDIFYYILHNPWHFTKLMAERLFSFFKFTRSWYSASHNILVAAFIIPVYLFFFTGISKLVRQRNNLLIYIIALLVLYPLAATLQCDDWHSRFTMPMLPPIFAISAYGFFSLFTKMTKKIN